MAQCGFGGPAAHGAAVALSELVANAVLHGGGLVTVRAAVSAERVACEVTDTAAAWPVAQDAEDDDEHHRGLALVEALTSEWRVRARPGGGKTVAFAVLG